VFKLGVVMFNCLHGEAPPYLVELYQPVAGVASRQHNNYPIRHSTAPGRTATPTQLLWQTDFLCGWPVGLEFPTGQLAKSVYYWREQFQTISEDVSVYDVLIHSAQ